MWQRSVLPSPHQTTSAEYANWSGRFADAVAEGALRQSPALADKLTGLERELAQARTEAARPVTNVVDLPLRIAVAYKRMVCDLREVLGRDPNKARAAIRSICGQIPVEPDLTGKFLVAELRLSDAPLLLAMGAQKFVVAGVGFEPTTFGL